MLTAVLWTLLGVLPVNNINNVCDPLYGTAQDTLGVQDQAATLHLSRTSEFRNAPVAACSEEIRSVDPDAITNDFSDLIRASGLPHLTVHGLRHAHATMLLEAGINPKIVSERLGHSTISVTMDVYSHCLPGMQEAAALALDEKLSLR